MSEVTHLSMQDARDAEDRRLLEDGEIDLLLAGWYETIRARMTNDAFRVEILVGPA